MIKRLLAYVLYCLPMLEAEGIDVQRLDDHGRWKTLTSYGFYQYEREKYGFRQYRYYYRWVEKNMPEYRRKYQRVRIVPRFTLALV